MAVQAFRVQDSQDVYKRQDEWNDDLWKKISILYAYKGAHYTYDELNEEYDRLVQSEKKTVLKRCV